MVVLALLESGKGVSKQDIACWTAIYKRLHTAIKCPRAYWKILCF